MSAPEDHFDIEPRDPMPTYEGYLEKIFEYFNKRYPDEMAEVLARLKTK